MVDVIARKCDGDRHKLDFARRNPVCDGSLLKALNSCWCHSGWAEHRTRFW